MLYQGMDTRDARLLYLNSRDTQHLPGDSDLAINMGNEVRH